MGGRYLVSGTQLGNLIFLCKTNPDEANKQINEIIENQFVYDSEDNIEKDIKKLLKSSEE